MKPNRYGHRESNQRSADWDAFAARCQKPEHTRIGTWMARKVSRPAALRITWLIAPWGVSAHAVTLTAWAVAMAGVFALGWGTVGGWLLAVALLQAWYLLDHVDGQLARWHGAVSLDGAQLDYLMHHAVQLLVPCGIGWGLFVRIGEAGWILVGGVWGTARLLNGLLEDTQFKAFEQRWKRLMGTLQLVGGAGGRPAPHVAPQHSRWRKLAWAVRKSGEMHVVMNLLTLLVIVAVPAENLAWAVLGWLTVLMAALSVGFFVRDLIRSLRQQRVEQSFARWFQPLPGQELNYIDGWWQVGDFRESTATSENQETV